MSKEVDLEGMPPIKKVRKRIKKHHTTKNVPVEVSIRRQVSEEIGDDEPTKDEKFVLLQKYGVTAPRIDRLVTKPNWMGVSEWKRKQNDWFKATKGLVSAAQRPRSSFRPTSNSSQQVPYGTQTGLQKKADSPQTRPSSTPTANLPQQHVQYQKPVGHRPWREIKHKNPNHPSNRRTDSPRNSNPTRTETPRS